MTAPFLTSHTHLPSQKTAADSIEVAPHLGSSAHSIPSTPALSIAPSVAMADSLETPNKKKDGHVPSPLQSLSSSTASLGRSPPAGLMATSPSPHTHRGSFAEQMRGGPGSPRASRQPSLSQQAFQDLINNPPTKAGDPKFHGRDWKTVRLGEIVDPALVRFAEYDTSVEDATSVRPTSQD